MSSFAKQKWDVLRGFVTNKTLSTGKKRSHTFALFTSTSSKDLSTECNEIGYEWLEYTSTHFPQCTLLIRERVRGVSWQDATGFDNTGNICVWPAEEILAYLCIKDEERFRGKAVCELGAGMTGLAGLMLAVAGNAKEILLTDGNTPAVHNLSVINNANKSAFGETIVNNRLLEWHNKQTYYEQYRNNFDYVICADSLLFEEYHTSLLNVMSTITTHEGHVIMVSPQRGDALEKFVHKAKAKFSVEEIQNYDEHIWNQYMQEKELYPFSEAVANFPLLLHLTKK